jgi:hypothetical protein
MCEYRDNIKNILEEFSGSEAIKKMQEETAKEIVVGLIDELGVSIESLGLTIEDLDNNKFMHIVGDNEEIVDDTENFAKKKLVNLYRYVAHKSSGYGSDNLGKNSRTFCKRVSKRTNVSLMRYVDILKLNGSNPGFGQGGSNIYSVFRFRGGVNCKHIWVKYSYDTVSRKLQVAPKSEQPKMIGAGGVPNA